MNPEEFAIYKTTAEYKMLSPKSKRRLRDSVRYSEKREEKKKYQAEYRQSESGKSIIQKHNEKSKQNRAEKMKLKKSLKLRHRMKNILLENSDHELGNRLFHLITTGEIDHSIHGKIADKDLELLKSFVLPDLPESERKEEKQIYYEKNKDKKLDYEKSRRTQKKDEVDEILIDLAFRRNDPNRVLACFEIEDSSSPKNICQREDFKLKIYKTLSEFEKPAFLEKCEKEWNAYLLETKAISLEYKINFLKSIGVYKNGHLNLFGT